VLKENKMAIQKVFETNFGVPAVYWRISKKDESYSNGAAYVLLEGFADEQARRDGKQPLTTKNVSFGKAGAIMPGPPMPMSSATTVADYVADADRATLYAEIMALAEYAGAVAV
jgi:hypothetical protein